MAAHDDSPTLEDRDDEGGVLLAFLFGLAAGATAALLFAPTEGSQARQYVAETARVGRDRAATAAERGREIWERQRMHLEQAVERGRDAYRAARDRAGAPESNGGH